ncbi:MAG: phosphopantothenoylcysteine decarboxylase [Phycisphaeraceae bacterium JB051]
MHILITAGPTREPIDGVRYLSNRSSGKMGLAIAQAAIEVGHEVTLLLGPIGDVRLHEEILVQRFESCSDLEALLAEHWPAHDLLIMAAAVADYRPNQWHDGKLERGKDMMLHLTPTPDLVKQAAQSKKTHQRVVAFALEDAAVLIERATAKMKRKGVDAIVANPLATMDAPDICPTWITADGSSLALDAMDKTEFARRLVAMATAL